MQWSRGKYVCVCTCTYACFHILQDCNNLNQCSCNAEFQGDTCDGKSAAGGNAGVIAGAIIGVLVVLAVMVGAIVVGVVIFFKFYSKQDKSYLPRTTPKRAASAPRNEPAAVSFKPSAPANLHHPSPAPDMRNPPHPVNLRPPDLPRGSRHLKPHRLAPQAQAPFNATPSTNRFAPPPRPGPPTPKVAPSPRGAPRPPPNTNPPAPGKVQRQWPPNETASGSKKPTPTPPKKPVYPRK